MMPKPPTPPEAASARDHAGAALVTLRTRVDAHFDAALARSKGAMMCRAGCASCCHVELTVFAIEADRIRAGLDALPQEQRVALRTRAAAVADEAHPRCVMLQPNDVCAIYDQRPIICRSHGAPVLVEDGESARVENCHLNYRDTTPDPASVLRLAAVNEPLSVMASLWGEAPRVSLRALAAEETSA